MNQPGAQIAILIARLGPYHVARVSALAAQMGADRCLVIEVAAESRAYPWDAVELSGLRRSTLIPGREYEDASSRELSVVTWRALEEEAPMAVALNGWGFPESRIALAWCRARGRT